jgi:hypothetical protein
VRSTEEAIMISLITVPMRLKSLANSRTYPRKILMHTFLSCSLSFGV